MHPTEVVATDDFYGSDKEQYDTVMIAKHGLIDNEIESTNSGFARVYVLKVCIPLKITSSS